MICMQCAGINHVVYKQKHCWALQYTPKHTFPFHRNVLTSEPMTKRMSFYDPIHSQHNGQGHSFVVYYVAPIGILFHDIIFVSIHVIDITAIRIQTWQGMHMSHDKGHPCHMTRDARVNWQRMYVSQGSLIRDAYITWMSRGIDKGHTTSQDRGGVHIT